MTHEPSLLPAASRRGQLTLLGLSTAILVLAAIHFAWPILAPLVFSLFVIALVWPLQLALQRRIPRLLGVVVTVLVVTVTIAVIGTLLTWGFSRAARWLIADAARFQAIYLQTTEWLEGHGFAVAGLFGDVFTPSRMLATVQTIGVRLQMILSFTIVTLVFTILGLLEVDHAAAKLRAMPNAARAAALARATRDTATKLQTYMLVRTAMSLITGALVAGFAALVGLPLAVEWGVIAFALNYIPFIGPFVATVIPTLFAVAHFGSWEIPLAVFAGFNVIQFVVGSYLEPRVAGNALSISPFIVLLAVFLWSFLWGLPGAFIGVPIVIAVLTICEQFEGSRWVARLLAGPGAEKK
jgi:predicted PurR-regulated permease PerM